MISFVGISSISANNYIELLSAWRRLDFVKSIGATGRLDDLNGVLEAFSRAWFSRFFSRRSTAVLSTDAY